jgi:hypothetical protein
MKIKEKSMRSLMIGLLAMVLTGCAMTHIEPPPVLALTPAEVAAIRSAQIGRFIAACDERKQSWEKRCKMHGGDAVAACGARAGSYLAEMERMETERRVFKEKCETFDADWADPCPALERLATKDGKASYFSREYLTKECKERQRSAL